MSEPVVAFEPHDEIVHGVVQVNRLDEELTAEMQAAVIDAAAQDRTRPVVLDLSRLEFMPSLSLGAIVRAYGDCKKHGQRLILVGPQPSVRSALAVTRLDKLFEIHDTVDEALARIRQSAASE